MLITALITLCRGDFGVPSIVNLLDMVKVFTFAVDQGKVAVHCHAGLGELKLEFILSNICLVVKTSVTFVTK